MVSVRDVIENFKKHDFAKRGKSSEPTQVLKYDSDSRTATVAGKRGYFSQAVIEYEPYAIDDENLLAREIQNAIDICEESIAHSILNWKSPKTSKNLRQSLVV